MTLVEIWIRFASGAIADPNMTAKKAAIEADRLVEEFKERFREGFDGWEYRGDK